MAAGAHMDGAGAAPLDDGALPVPGDRERAARCRVPARPCPGDRAAAALPGVRQARGARRARPLSRAGEAPGRRAGAGGAAHRTPGVLVPAAARDARRAGAPSRDRNTRRGRASPAARSGVRGPHPRPGYRLWGDRARPRQGATQGAHHRDGHLRGGSRRGQGERRGAGLREPDPVPAGRWLRAGAGGAFRPDRVESPLPLRWRGAGACPRSSPTSPGRRCSPEARARSCCGASRTERGIFSRRGAPSPSKSPPNRRPR